MPRLSLPQWFVVWLVAVLVLIVVFQPAERPSKIDVVSFETTESAELYFRNQREFYYRTTEEGEGAFAVYRLNTVFEDSSASLPFAIYHMRRANRAFVRLDTARIDLRRYRSVSIDCGDEPAENVAMPGPYNEEQYRFAATLYQRLDEGCSVTLIGANDRVELDPSQLKSVKRVLRDYFRLIGKI